MIHSLSLLSSRLAGGQFLQEASVWGGGEPSPRSHTHRRPVLPSPRGMSSGDFQVTPVPSRVRGPLQAHMHPVVIKQEGVSALTPAGPDEETEARVGRGTAQVTLLSAEEALGWRRGLSGSSCPPAPACTAPRQRACTGEHPETAAPRPPPLCSPAPGPASPAVTASLRAAASNRSHYCAG